MKLILRERSWCGLVAIFVALCVFSTAAVQLVTVQGPSFAPQAGGSGDSGLSIISRDGRYVLFASTANNLTLTNNNNFVLPRRFNVFLRDRLAGTTTLVSVNMAGNGGGNGDSLPTGISTNGQFALFESSASDLIAGDTNNASDIFMRDLVNGLTTLVSVSTNGTSGNGASRGSVMTGDGRYVAFVSTASNLVPGDTNGIADVFVRDLQAGTTTLASVGAITNSNPLITGTVTSSESPEITPDGRYVVFYSTATNLVPKVAPAGDIFVRDMLAGNTTWASTNARVIAQSLTGNANFVSCNFSISDDGQFVAFEACTNSPSGSTALGIVLRYRLPTGLTDIICTNASVPLSSFPNLHNLAMTPDGRFTAFVAYAGNVSGTNTAIYLWDAQTGTNTLASAKLDNSGPANGFCDSPVVSANGQFVAFVSTATNLVANTLAGGWHVYLRDTVAGVTQLLDADTNGVGVGVAPTMVPALSADGSVVAFDSANLLSDNRHVNYNVFACDLTAGATSLISARQAALSSPTPDGLSGLTPLSVSANGRFVAFYSDADDLVPNDTNGFGDVFVRDLIADRNILVSVNTNGNAPGDGLSTEPAISSNGQYVVFTSSTDNLVPGGTNARNVYIRDLQAGTMALVSVSTDGITPGNGDSFLPIISANGRYVLFHSKASNLAAGSSGGGTENLFFRDLQTGTTYALTSALGGVGVYSAASMTPDGQSVAFIGRTTKASGTLFVWNSQSNALSYTSSPSFPSSPFPFVSISPNGQKLAYLANTPANLYVADLVANTVSTINTNGSFSSHAGLQFSSDGRFLTYAGKTNSTSGIQSVLLYDFQTGTNLLISQNFNSLIAANTNADSPAISPNGRFIAYHSFATNLVSMDSYNVADLFIYDAASNTTYLVSVNEAGNSSADDRSLKPVFSSDSQTLYFQSWASDMSGNDFNNDSDIFALDLALPLPGSGGGGSTNSVSGPYAQLIPAGTFGPNPVISWPLASGESYQVQFKTNLTDSVWLNLPGNAAFIGASGYFGDPSPAPGQRFYRIVLTP
jgi:Tol biopolymer transport system component